MSGWVPALRIARRELLRARARTALVLLLVALPVVAVVALSTLLRTADVGPAERLDGRLGPASARLEPTGSPVDQTPDLSSVTSGSGTAYADRAALLERLPEGARLLEVRDAGAQVRLDVDGQVRRVALAAVDLSDPAVRGPYALVAGRVPSGADEVAVAPTLAGRGLPLGRSVVLGGRARTVVGVVAGPPDQPGDLLVAPAAADELVGDGRSTFYASGPPVRWSDVRALNEVGVLVLSRSVVLSPPPASAVTAPDPSTDQVLVALVALVAVMAVIEVVLLAGPAFAVGARRQRRSLALLAATGGEPRHVRRVVLAQGLVVGLVAAGAGVPLGIGIAAAARGPLVRWAGADLGPFDVRAGDVALVGLLGAGTALLAAVLPALVAARVPVATALADRRLSSTRTAWPAGLGALLLAAGTALSLLSLRGELVRGYPSELGIAAGAIPTVLGAVLLAPAALALSGRTAARLPLPLRFATRDASRQRARTAPAAAAIAATVAAAVALGISSGSDSAQARRDAVPQGPAGAAVVTGRGLPDVDLRAAAQAARSALPGEPVVLVRGLPTTRDGGAYEEVQVCAAGTPPGACGGLASSWRAALGSAVLVGPDAAAQLSFALGQDGVRQLQQALARGEAAVAVDAPLAPGTQVVLLRVRRRVGPDGSEQATVLSTQTVPAVRLPAPGDGAAPAQVVLPDALAQALDPQPVALVVGDDLSRAQERTLRQAVLPLDDALSLDVERGPDGGSDRTVLLVLVAVAAVLVLGGTLAATALALTEARPDLATLGQLGARPRTRRLVAASYAVVLGLVGALLGAAAGAVPGVAAAVSLTRDPYGPVHHPAVVVVPWLLLAVLLVGLPLMSGGVAALSVRSPTGARREVA